MDAHSGIAAVLALPDDILEDVLRRLRAHSRARCRCVCAPWRGLVDARGLLRPHALPRAAFPGFFANLRVSVAPWNKPCGPSFLPLPASRDPAVDRFAFLRPHLSNFVNEVVVQDQCNGLVLCFRAGVPTAGFVCNPATRRWARLPEPPVRWPREHDGAFLAFDPAVSLDYEAFLLPVPPSSDGEIGIRVVHNKATLGIVSEPARGRTGRGRREAVACARVLVGDRAVAEADARAGAVRPGAAIRQGDAAAAHGADVAVRRVPPGYAVRPLREERPCGAAVRGGHVRHGQAPVSPSGPRRHGTVRRGPRAGEPPRDRHLLGRRRRGRRAAAVRQSRRVPRQGVGAAGVGRRPAVVDKDLAAHARMLPLLHDAPSNCGRPEQGANDDKRVWFSDEDGEDIADANGGEGVARLSTWNWDDASLLDMEVGDEELLGDAAAGSPSPFSILGFHPSGKEKVVYLASGSAFHVVAYHLSSGKVRYMGRVVSLDDGDRLDGVFAYRPCVVDALPRDNSCLFPSLTIGNKRR